MIDINMKEQYNLKEIYGKKFDNYLKSYTILQNEDVVDWITDKIGKFTSKGKEASKFSITSYLLPLQAYCKYNQTNNPSDLLKEKLKLRNNRFHVFLDFLLNATEEDTLKIKEIGFKRNPSEVSIKNNIQGRIKSFFSDRAKHITYSIETVQNGKNKNELKLTKSMIMKIKAKLESPTYRLICKFQTQLGLRISDILEELISGKYDIEKYEITKENYYYYIKDFTTGKSKVTINYLFFTEELSNLLQSIYSIDDLTKLDLTTLFKTKNKTTINKNNYLIRLKQIAKELGIEENIKTHCFRKYFSGQIRRIKGVDIEFKEHLMGHSSPNLSPSYANNLKDIFWYFTEWAKIEESICVDCIVKDNTNEKVNTLTDKTETLQKRFDELVKTNVKQVMENETMKSQFSKLLKEFSNLADKFDDVNAKLEAKLDED